MLAAFGILHTCERGRGLNEQQTEQQVKGQDGTGDCEQESMGSTMQGQLVEQGAGHAHTHTQVVWGENKGEREEKREQRNLSQGQLAFYFLTAVTF